MTKKKKVLWTLVIAVLSAVLLFILTACGRFNLLKNGGGNGDDGDGDDDNTPPEVTYTFSTDSWETIAQVSSSGKAREYYAIGDEKTVNLSTGEPVTFQILGFDHDDLSDGSGKAGITLGMKNLLAKQYRANSTAFADDAAFGWSQTQIRNTVLAGIFTQLPTELREVIKPVTKVSLYNAADAETTEDKLFLFSRGEFWGDTALEGTQYEYWSVNTPQNAKQKFLENGLGESAGWCFRTFSGEKNRSIFFASSSSVVMSTGMVYGTFGVCFGFCI